MSQRIVRRPRKGNILMLSAIMMVMMMAMLAFAVDIGYLCVAREELQRSADAAALAGAWELVDPEAPAGDRDYSDLGDNAYTSAGNFAALNPVLTQAPRVRVGDVKVGFMQNPTDSTASMDLSGLHAPNVVRVNLRRDGVQNDRVPLFFARFMGFDSAVAEAQATAALLTNFNGFQTPSDGSNLDLLPFALDLTTWTALLAGVGQDNFRWNAATNRLESGHDGILEVNLYPQGTGSPGNRGTVDIGSNNNSTADIARQILTGISSRDLSYHGGKLQFNSQGKLFLNGDTGISAGVKDELASIIGKVRIIPIFESVAGPGNNASYTIVQFAGVRILAVKLTGSNTTKNVMIQPANIVTKGAIPATTTGSSSFVYSPAWLIR